MSDPYLLAYKTKLQSQHLRHRLRVAQLRWRIYWYEKACYRSLHSHSMLNQGGMVRVDSRLQPPPHRYGNLSGPWIESAFFRYWNSRSACSPCHYLPILFDPIFFHSQTQKYTPKRFRQTLNVLRDTLDQLDSSLPYFTLQGFYDHPIWDWHLFPRHCLVFSASGCGDITIPMLSGDREFRSPPKDIFLSFVGSLQGASNAGNVRQRMARALDGFAYFGRGPNWEEIMGRSVFSLCPRGLGPTSFRLYEAMSMGSIPIYVWDKVKALPYCDELDWSQFSVSICIDEIESLPDVLANISQKRILFMQQKLAEIYYSYFTLEAVCGYILKVSGAFDSASSVRKITNSRNFR